MKNRETKYWIIVASKDHVKKGVAERIAQACHGKASPLKRMQPSDFVIYYSGKQMMGKPEKCQEFTAIGKVADDEIYDIKLSEDYCPSRRRVDFLESEDISILPLIEDLAFIQNKKSWGYPFRFGMLEIPKQDFNTISSKMLKKEYV